MRKTLGKHSRVFATHFVQRLYATRVLIIKCNNFNDAMYTVLVSQCRLDSSISWRRHVPLFSSWKSEQLFNSEGFFVVVGESLFSLEENRKLFHRFCVILLIEEKRRLHAFEKSGVESGYTARF